MKFERYPSIELVIANDGAETTEPQPLPVKAKLVGLDRDMSVQQAMAKIAEACLTHMEANEAAVREGRDPEGVHQMRVAVRRLRSALSILRHCLPDDLAARLQLELRWFADQLSPARDWDVFKESCLQPAIARMPDRSEVAALLRQVEDRRLEAYGVAIASVNAPRYGGLKSLLRAWLDQDIGATLKRKRRRQLAMPVADMAADVLQRRHKKLRQLGGRHRVQSLPELHALRIKTKKLRYAAEFFRQLYPPAAQGRYHAAVAGLQEVLGHINDAAVAQERLHELTPAPSADLPLPGLVPDVRPEIARHLDLVIAQQRDAFRAAWRKFRRCEPFWQRRGGKGSRPH